MTQCSSAVVDAVCMGAAPCLVPMVTAASSNVDVCFLVSVSCFSDRGKGRQRQAILGEYPSSYSDNGYGETKTLHGSCSLCLLQLQ